MFNELIKTIIIFIYLYKLIVYKKIKKLLEKVKKKRMYRKVAYFEIKIENIYVIIKNFF